MAHNKCLVDIHHYGNGNDDDIHLWNQKKQAFLQSVTFTSAFYLFKKNYLVRKHNKSFCLFPFLKLNKKTMFFKAVLIPINSSNVRYSNISCGF